MASWESKSNKKKGTHHGIDLEDVTEMVLRRFMILGNVGKVSEIVSILTGPVDIADFVLADGLLSGGNDRREIQIGGTKKKKKKYNRGVSNAMARVASTIDACGRGKTGIGPRPHTLFT